MKQKSGRKTLMIKIKEGELLFEVIWQINGDCGITGRFANSLASLPEGLRFYF